MAKLACFLRDENGATAIEYALVAAGLTIAIIGTIGLVGGSLSDLFLAIAGGLPE
ncbi:MAG: Flp family type IVb pilin [Cohaesibacteraceae bacterium]